MPMLLHNVEYIFYGHLTTLVIICCGYNKIILLLCLMHIRYVPVKKRNYATFLTITILRRFVESIQNR